jgi:hypothetical protein
LYQQKAVVGGFTSDFFWSSSELDTYSAWAQQFNVGFQHMYGKNNPMGVRAVRAF